MNRITLLVGIMLVFIAPASAQNKVIPDDVITRLQTELVSPWSVTVKGEPQTRTMRITKSDLKSERTLALEATFGLTGQFQGPITPEVSLDQEIKLSFATAVGSRFETVRTSSGTFEGTITYKGGTTRPVVIQRLSEDELSTKIIIKPGADVPAACASLSGKWDGQWNGDARIASIWIRRVNSDCTVEFAYTSAKTPVYFAKAQVNGDTFSFGAPLCANGGTCVVKRSSRDGLEVSYSSPDNGSVSTADFKRDQ